MPSFLPPSYPINVYVGDTLSFTLTYKEGATDATAVGVDLTGATLAGQLRTAVDAATATADFAITADADQVTNPGLMSIVLSATETAKLITAAAYSYDIQVTWSDGRVQTLLKGRATVSRDVTR